jgi:ketosteroid isomerase-like protein
VTAHDELRSLVQRYARAVDRRDVEALAGLFRPDATIVGARGAQTVPEWLDTMRAPRAFPRSMHLLGDPLIDLGEGGAVATLDTYAVVYQLSDPGSGNADMTLGINYLDEVVREDGRWRITRRESHTLWMR